MKASINSIESYGTLDGPGIRCVVFLNKCLLRCKYCHNPEMWNMQGLNYTSDELVEKIKRFKPYFKRNNGGVTFSGGEPLLQSEFLLETLKKLKEEKIHIALDTAGYTNEPFEEILDYVDLIIYDIKDITEERYKELTGGNINKTLDFIKKSNDKNKKFWIRQVVVPELHDNESYILALADYICKNFKTNNIEKIEFLPYHKFGSEKYEKLKLLNPYKYLQEMDSEKCEKLYQKFIKIYSEKINN